MKNCDEGLENTVSSPQTTLFVQLLTYPRHTSRLQNAVDHDELNVLTKRVFDFKSLNLSTENFFHVCKLAKKKFTQALL